MEHKNLYLAYKDNGYLGECSTSSGAIYLPGAIKNIKVVACPFCDVSTSSGETVMGHSHGAQFWCSSCNTVAMLTSSSKSITRDRVARIHPWSPVLEIDAEFHLAEIYKITSVIIDKLMHFTQKGTEGNKMGNNDVATFYDEFVEFCNENKVNGDVKEFLKNNELAIKYGVEHSTFPNKRTKLTINLDSYNLLDVGNYLRDVIYVIFKVNYCAEINCSIMPWFVKKM